MPGATRRGWKVAARVLQSVATVDLAVSRVQGAYRHFFEGLLPSVLTDAELTNLSTRLYDRRGPNQFGHEPLTWELQWLEKHLPNSPAHILVGGAGYGRECAWLQQLGHSVDACEPSRAAAVQCQRVVASSGGTCVVASHEDFADAVLDGTVNAATPLSRRAYDVVVLGWGSLSHVLDPEQRARIIDASSRIAGGPILASARVSNHTTRPFRAERFGRTVGLRFGGRDLPFGILFQPEVGFAATLSPAELERIARRAHRRLEWTPGPGIAAIVFAPDAG